MSNRWRLDPDDDAKFYIFDFAPLANGKGDSNWLDQTTSPIETISSATVTNVDSPGLTISNVTITDSSTSVTCKLAGGTLGVKYQVKCSITTSTGQTTAKTAIVRCINE